MTAGFSAMVRAPGVLPLAGVTVTNAPPVPGTNDAVNGMLPPVLVTWTVCDPEMLVPSWADRFTVFEESDSVGAAPTVSVTGTYSGLLPAPGTITVTTPA